ncbi:metallothionein-like protein 4B [Malus sylvestris]|uniref:metallothionein-like protein 4B n=1 Tax=Malus sylvestris TaxID=3752 RepID=UPI0021AC481A|nr:metallothionein-like protein 4B [Malus sylvestris]
MADTTTAGGLSASCNDRCGCTNPCPGGASCKCTTTSDTTSGGDHMTCSCGEHCSCNPCTCAESVVTAGKAKCTCGAGCACVSCAA